MVATGREGHGVRYDVHFGAEAKRLGEGPSAVGIGQLDEEASPTSCRGIHFGFVDARSLLSFGQALVPPFLEIH